MNFNKIVASVIVGGLLFASCKKDEPEEYNELQIPSSYDGQNFETNASSQLELVQKLGDLSSAMKVGRTDGNNVDKADLDNIFTDGNPSLADKVTAYYKNRIERTAG